MKSFKHSNPPGAIGQVLAVIKNHLSNVFCAAPYLQPRLEDGEIRKFQYLAGEALKQLEEKHGHRARLVVPMMMHHSSTKAIVGYMEDLKKAGMRLVPSDGIVLDDLVDVGAMENELPEVEKKEVQG